MSTAVIPVGGIRRAITGLIGSAIVVAAIVVTAVSAVIVAAGVLGAAAYVETGSSSSLAVTNFHSGGHGQPRNGGNRVTTSCHCY